MMYVSRLLGGWNPQKALVIFPKFLQDQPAPGISGDLFKVILCGFYHGKSPCLPPFGESLVFFPTTLSKSKESRGIKSITGDEPPLSLMNALLFALMFGKVSLKSHEK